MSGVLKSRKAVLGVLALVFYAVVLLFPETREIADKVAPVLAAIVGMVVLGITFEDSVKWWSERPLDIAATITALAEEVVRLIHEAQPPPADTEPPANG